MSPTDPLSISQPAPERAYRSLPSVSDLLGQCPEMLAVEGRPRVVQALRRALDAARERMKRGDTAATPSQLVAAAAADLRGAGPRDTPAFVINATGVVIHTNLGRAPLSAAAQRAMLAAAAEYAPLEYDLHSGERGARGALVAGLLRELTGAEDALVVNNCAAATLLMLAALARGRGVVIARGQLVEIGGGFRVPEIMEQSGAKLIEVGTTNKVRVGDYAARLADPDSAAILVVHPSNFRVIGFTAEVGLDALAVLTREAAHPAWLLHDLGSGALVDTARFGISREPTVQDSVAAGADVTAFSGDKLLGGPQAGILAGKARAIGLLRAHPLARAMRADKTVLAALGATLLHYARGEAEREVPVLRMLSAGAADIGARATSVMARIAAWADARGVVLSVVEGESTVGGGSLPGESLATRLIAMRARHPDDLAAELRALPTPIIARIREDNVMLDLRTVLDDEALARALQP